jgi:hypothetical protein
MPIMVLYMLPFAMLATASNWGAIVVGACFLGIVILPLMLFSMLGGVVGVLAGGVLLGCFVGLFYSVDELKPGMTTSTLVRSGLRFGASIGLSVVALFVGIGFFLEFAVQ